jgi:hypothetical protein
MALMPVINLKYISDPLVLALEVDIPSGIYPGPSPVFSCHLLSRKPRPDIYTYILTQLPRFFNIGCSASVDNGKVSPKMYNIPSILTGSSPFATMVNPAGLHGQQPTLLRQEGISEQGQ